ncbi:hypothetical protein CBM2585_B110070 [Cupriavidus taiwanensis]|nr:hypothetical protein CBM2585_B110070 [Cupriavidus taiwanensis]
MGRPAGPGRHAKGDRHAAEPGDEPDPGAARHQATAGRDRLRGSGRHPRAVRRHHCRGRGKVGEDRQGYELQGGVLRTGWAALDHSRSRAGGNPVTSRRWIPACAGMTVVSDTVTERHGAAEVAFVCLADGPCSRNTASGRHAGKTVCGPMKPSGILRPSITKGSPHGLLFLSASRRSMNG